MRTFALTDDIATCLQIRRTVFIEEQRVPEDLEVDGLDDAALHLLAFVDGEAMGTARLFVDGTSGKIGRVAVLRPSRGTGLGKALILKAMDVLRERGAVQAKLGAQSPAIGFYEGLGYRAYGPEYMDAGIPHRDMVADL